MRKGNTLVNVLYWLCNISFYLLIVLFIFTQVFEVLGRNIKFGNGTLGTHNSFMYQVPVKFQINPKKPIFSNTLYEKKMEGIASDGGKYYSGTRHYSKPLTAEDSLNFKTIVSIKNKGLIDQYEFLSPTFLSKGYVNIKPKTLLNKIIIVVRTYLNLIVLILVFFFLKTIFKELKTKFQFSNKLSKFIKIVGALLVFNVLLDLVSSYILGSALPIIKIEPIDRNLRYVDLYMNPRLEFDLVLFLTGLSLIILSILLKEGYRIKQENDLTI